MSPPLKTAARRFEAAVTRWAGPAPREYLKPWLLYNLIAAVVVSVAMMVLDLVQASVSPSVVIALVAVSAALCAVRVPFVRLAAVGAVLQTIVIETIVYVAGAFSSEPDEGDLPALLMWWIVTFYLLATTMISGAIVSFIRQMLFPSAPNALEGECPHCCYQLKGLTRCPECGNEPGASTRGADRQ